VPKQKGKSQKNFAWQKLSGQPCFFHWISANRERLRITNAKGKLETP